MGVHVRALLGVLNKNDVIVSCGSRLYGESPMMQAMPLLKQMAKDSSILAVKPEPATITVIRCKTCKTRNGTMKKVAKDEYQCCECIRKERD